MGSVKFESVDERPGLQPVTDMGLVKLLIANQNPIGFGNYDPIISMNYH